MPMPLKIAGVNPSVGRPRADTLMPPNDGLSAIANWSGVPAPGELESATQFGVLLGKLATSNELDDGIKSLLFGRSEKE
ncbi:MAG: hypothetical protein ACU84Q_15005 [Gammaproteobacteria bacterium]